MREFLIYSRGHTGGKIGKEIRNYGRLDVVAQVIRSAFFISGDTRKNVMLHLSLNGPPRPPLYLKFNYKTICTRDVEKLIRRSISGRKTDYLIKEKKTFIDIVKNLHENNKNIFILDKRGENISNIKFKEEDNVFILGDDKGIPKLERKLISKIARKISIGPKMYMASQCVSFLNIYLDIKNIY